MNYHEIHKNTFGDSKCAEDLASILNDYNNKKYTQTTGKILHRFNSSVDDLLLTKRYTEDWLRRFYESSCEYLDKISFLPDNVKSRIKNLFTARYRNSLKEISS